MEILLFLIRYTINGIAIYSVLQQNKFRKLSMKNKIIKILPFECILVPLLTTVSYFFVGPYTFLLSLLLSTVYFYIKEEKFKKLKLTFLSLMFLHVVLMIINLISTSFGAIIHIIFKKFNIIIPSLIDNFIILFVYTFIIFLFIKKDVIKAKILDQFIYFKGFHIITFSIWLFIIIFYYCVIFHSNNVKSCATLFMIVCTLSTILVIYFVLIANNLHELYIKTKNEKEKQYILTNLGKSSRKSFQDENKISFCKSTYKDDWDNFASYLKAIRMGPHFNGYNQMILALIFVKNSPSKNPDFKNNIYPQVAEWTSAPNGKSVARNIETVIRSVWYRTDPEILASEYTNEINTKTGIPTNKDFIMYVVRKIINNEK